MKIKYIMIILLISSVLLGCNEKRDETDINLDEPDLLMAGPVVVEDKQPKNDTILVFVCGAVNDPGVYEMEAEARVCDAIIRAGDFTGDADTEFLNQAAGLSDGQKLYVPCEGELVEGNESADEVSGLININRASASELKTLPGIGDVKADAIISYRENHGDFASIEDIQQVDGIKSGLYDSIKGMITVN